MAQLDLMEKRGSGLKKICNATRELETYKEGRDPVFKSSVSQFMTVIYSMEYQPGKSGQLNGTLSGTLNGILNDTLNKILKVLTDRELIERRGSKKTGGYYAK
jgi:ATP-dependent DNA helicase RecG